MNYEKLLNKTLIKAKYEDIEKTNTKIKRSAR